MRSKYFIASMASSLAVFGYSSVALAQDVVKEPGFIEQTINLSIAGFAAFVATVIVSTGLGWFASQSKKAAAPALQKSPEDRTLVEIAIIEANKRIQALDRQQLYDFIANEVASHSKKIVNSPTFDPIRAADEVVTDSIERFRSRNPELAEKIDLTPQDFADLLAAGFGKAQMAIVNGVAALESSKTPVITSEVPPST